MGVSFDFSSQKWRNDYDSSEFDTSHWQGNENFTKKGLKRKETMENRFATFNPLYFPTYPNMKDFMVRTFRRNCSLIENYDDYYVGLRHYGHTFCQDNTSHYLGIERVTCDLMAESKLSYETYLMTLVLIR